MATVMADQRALAGSFTWNERDGVVWTGPHAVVHVDHGEGQARLLLRFGADGRDVPLGIPAVMPGEKGGLSLVYRVTMVEGGQLEVRRRFEVGEFDGGHDLVETMELRPARPIRQDVEVVRENKGRVLVTRVHALPKPLTIAKFRVVVTRVVPAAGGIARLLQVEAWGAPPDAGK